MLTTISKPTSLPPRRAGKEHFSPRFRGAATGVIREGVVDITHLKTAEAIQQLFKWAKKDVRMGGLSLEDMAGRLQTAIGVYLLQGFYAVKEEKHPWETNGRNAIVWLMTLALTSLTKSENYGVNTVFLNPFMKQKGTAVRFAPSFIRNAIDALRMDMDYVDIIEKCGIKISDSEKAGAQKGTKALWASSWLDANKVEKVQNKLLELSQKDTLTDAEKELKEAIPKFFKRINTFNMASTAIITAATVYFIGGVAMRIVNKFISPLDKDFDGNKPNKPPVTPGQIPPQPAISRPALLMPSMPNHPILPPILPIGTTFYGVPKFQQNPALQTMILPSPGKPMNAFGPSPYGLSNGQGGLN